MDIEDYTWGKIVIGGQPYTSDVIIFPDHINPSWWRKEGHKLQVDDLQEVISANPEIVIIGTGALGVMKVPRETVQHLESRGIQVHIERTGKAVELLNGLRGNKKVVAALHLTC